jgi:peptidoglycan biosynthesis protein MviN/MurJ (putative lipid II flippase)
MRASRRRPDPPRFAVSVGIEEDVPPAALVARSASTARSSAVVSASFVLTNLLGGLLAVLIVVIAGEGPATDGFLAAYSAYLTFVLFGSTLRAALVPLLGPTDDELAFRRRAADRVARLAAAAGVIAVVLACLAPLLGRVLVPQAPADAQVTAATSIAILAVAAWAQVWAAALAAVLSASRRFVSSAILYTGSTAVTLAAAAALLVLLGVVGAAVALLIGAVALLAGHVGYLQRLGFAAVPAWRAVAHADTWALVARALAGAAVPVALQVNLSIALAATSHVPGAVTGYSYAYLIAVTVSGVTSSTIALTTMPGLVQSLHDRGPAAADEYIRAIAPFSVFLYVPAAAAYACFGRPLLDAVLGHALTPPTIDILWDASRIFLLMALVWAVLAPVIAAALSRRLFGGLAVVSGAAVLVQLVLMLAIGGRAPLTIAAGHAATGTLLMVAVLVLVAGRRAGAVAIGAVRGSLPALPLALVFPALELAGFDRSVAASVAGVILGGALYLALAAKLWPSVGGQAIRLLLARG